MEDLTLALITLTSFVLLFVVAIFADRVGAEFDEASTSEAPAATTERVAVPVAPPAGRTIDADVA